MKLYHGLKRCPARLAGQVSNMQPRSKVAVGDTANGSGRDRPDPCVEADQRHKISA